MTEGRVLRACVVGVGHLGRHHARILGELPDMDLIGVVDPHEERGRAAADLSDCAWHSSSESVIEDIDFAVIAVPTTLHLEAAAPFLKSGKSVLIEKPLAPDPATCRELLALAEKHGARIGVGHVERFNPAVRRAMELGIRPRFVEAHRLAPFSFRSTDVGVVLDLMIHDIDLVLAWTGETPEKIDAVGGRTLSATEDLCSARLQFPSGAVANLTASRLSMKPMRRFRVFGPDSYVSVDSQDQYALLVKKKGEFTPDVVAQAIASGDTNLALEGILETEELRLSDDEPLRAELLEFGQAIVANRAHEVTGEDGMRAVEIAHQVLDVMADSCWEG